MSKARQWFTFMAAEETGGNVQIYIYDYIGKSWWNERAMSATKLIEKLKECKGQHVDVHINSLGGDAFEGQAIHNALRRHDGGCTAYIDGIAYSAATHVALGCEKVVIAENALFGIHEAWTWCVGNRRDMLNTAAALEKVDHTQIVVYAGKTGLSRAEVLKTMEEDIPMTADEAYAAGYCDQVGDEVELETSARSQLDIAAHKIPDRFAAMMAARGFVEPAAAVDDDDLKEKLELVRDYAVSIVDTIDEALEDDEADADGSADTSVTKPVPDTSHKVGAEVAAVLLS